MEGREGPHLRYPVWLDSAYPYAEVQVVSGCCTPDQQSSIRVNGKTFWSFASCPPIAPFLPFLGKSCGREGVRERECERARQSVRERECVCERERERESEKEREIDEEDHQEPVDRHVHPHHLHKRDEPHTRARLGTSHHCDCFQKHRFQEGGDFESGHFLVVERVRERERERERGRGEQEKRTRVSRERGGTRGRET